MKLNRRSLRRLIESAILEFRDTGALSSNNFNMTMSNITFNPSDPRVREAFDVLMDDLSQVGIGGDIQIDEEIFDQAIELMNDPVIAEQISVCQRLYENSAGLLNEGLDESTKAGLKAAADVIVRRLVTLGIVVTVGAFFGSIWGIVVAAILYFFLSFGPEGGAGDSYVHAHYDGDYGLAQAASDKLAGQVAQWGGIIVFLIVTGVVAYYKYQEAKKSYERQYNEKF